MCHGFEIGSWGGKIYALQQDVSDDMREQVGIGGNHKGIARMSQELWEGMVGPDCRAYGASTLFTASSSAFPTSSQANPTLTFAAFAVRFAGYLTQNLETL